MAQHIIRAGRFFDPPRIEPCQVPHVVYGLSYIPVLVRVHHELPVPTNFFADDRTAADIILNISTHLYFEMGPTLRHGFATEMSQLLVGVPQPAGRRGVGRKALLPHL